VVEVEGFAMRFIPILLALLVACTSKNPNLCCIDEADCATVGLDEVKGCAEGLVCRGNQCIAEVCETSSECEASAPYCIAPPDGRCQESCTDDSQCPGFGQPSDDVFCVGGACVQCRDMADCSGSTPICSAGACVACVNNDDCSSQVCGDDGACVDEAMIAYVALTGSAGGQCTKAMPCSTIEFALALMPARPFIAVNSGTYSRSGLLNLNGTRRVIGIGPTRPIIKRTTDGSIINIVATSNIGLERLQIEGATGPIGRGSASGNAVCCNTLGGAQLRISDSVLQGNSSAGIGMQDCAATIIRSTFSGNANGIEATDVTAIIDRSTFTGNGRGANFDNAALTITNNFFTRNTGNGLQIFVFAGGSTIEFNTSVDNGGDGLHCEAQGTTISLANNITARNLQQISTDPDCTYPSSIIIDTDISALKFVSPDVAPFDYHIQTGSLAIDAADPAATLDHDFDNQPRAAGAADVGADEL
jgi:hypothetical protein